MSGIVLGIENTPIVNKMDQHPCLLRGLYFLVNYIVTTVSKF
jgi:hypothetical protein